MKPMENKPSHPRKTSAILAVIVLCALPVLAGFWFYNSPESGGMELTDVSGHLPDLQFSLISDRGAQVTAETYRGDVVLLYFGFSRCPDQCPAALSRLAGILRALGPEKDDVRVLFVSIDPAHDTPEALHKYLSGFGESQMIGLTGSEKAIGALAKRCRAAYRPGSVTHGNAIYLFDREGKARLIGMPDGPQSSLIHDVRRLIHDGR